MHWSIDPVLFHLGPLEIRWYGLFFATGLLLGVTTMYRSFQDRGLPKEHASSLSIWLPVGMILGAHLIHLLFYEPRSFIDNPRRIIEIGTGLASHGGGVGSVFAMWLFTRIKKVSFHRYLDAGVIGAAWIIPFVRIGNFFNSEIVGRPTDLPWAVVFERYDRVPRHPSQIYEAILGFILVGLALWAHRNRDRLKPGVTFYLLMGYYFMTRFFIEWVKEYQTLAPNFPLTMGQCLSIPVVIGCGLMVLRQSRQPAAALATGPPAAAKKSGPGRAAPGGPSAKKVQPKKSAPRRKKRHKKRR